MPPHTSTSETVTETVPVDRSIKEQFLSADLDEVIRLRESAKQEEFKPEIVWRNVALFVFLHIGALVGLYQLFTVATWPTFFFTFFCYVISGLGITAGAHRLWAHKSFKAKTPLKLILLAFNCVAFQVSTFVVERT
ncbi:FAT-6 protein [Aphelenchoides avenae]|nr:FAT-6 protein [Aphelenchus avenae]